MSTTNRRPRAFSFIVAVSCAAMRALYSVTERLRFGLSVLRVRYTREANDQNEIQDRGSHHSLASQSCAASDGRRALANGPCRRDT